MRFSRRRFIQAAGAAASAVAFPSYSQTNPIRLGLMTVKTGPLASGGIDMERALVGHVYIRRVERKEGRLVNRVIHTYPNVSQFWTYKPEEFLKNPVYSRDFPPAKNLES